MPGFIKIDMDDNLGHEGRVNEEITLIVERSPSPEPDSSQGEPPCGREKGRRSTLKYGEAEKERRISPVPTIFDVFAHEFFGK